MRGVVPPADVRVWLLQDPNDSQADPFCLTGEERLRRTLSAVGIASVGSVCDPPAAEGAVALFRSDVVFDERLVAALLAAEGRALVTSDPLPVPAAVRCDGAQLEQASRWLRRDAVGALPASLRLVTPDELVPPYHAKLRSVRPAYALRLREGTRGEVERALFAASYKDVTDLVTKWVWPRPALAVTRACARLRITPNSVTFVSWLLVAAATWLFARGEFGLGLAVAWLMTFLDTVDGKLARVTLRSSRVGHVFDHGLDLLHPPIWYFAWGLGLAGVAGLFGVDAATWIAVAGYVVGRVQEGIFLFAFEFEIHSWRRVDSRFRLVTARRNPNLILLTLGALGGRPDLGMVAVAGWTLASIAFHAVRMAMAAVERWSGAPLRGWQDAPLASGAGAANASGSGAIE